MKNLEFIKRIMLRNHWLWEERRYNLKLKDQYKILREHLEQTQILLQQEVEENKYFSIPSLGYTEALRQHRNNLLRELDNLERHIGYSRNRVQYYQKIADVHTTLG